MTNGAALIGFTLTNGATRAGGTDATNEQSGAGVCAYPPTLSSSLVCCWRLLRQYPGGGAYRMARAMQLRHPPRRHRFHQRRCFYLANLNNCIVSSNRLVQGSGGGGAAYGVLNNCLITGNTAYSGGGTNYSILNSCVVSNNSAQRSAAV